MALTRANFREEVDKNLGGRVATQDPSYTRLDRHLDLTMTRLGRAHEWKEMFRADTDTVTYTGAPATDAIYSNLPTNTKEIHGLMRYKSGDTQVQVLGRLPSRQWDQLIGKAQTLPIGDVTHYMVWNRTPSNPAGTPVIEWYRVPDATFTLYRRLSLWPVMGVGVAGVAGLINKDDLIIADCTHALFQSLGEREEAAVWYSIARDLFEKAKAEDLTRPDLDIIPRGLSAADITGPDYWTDPFVRGVY